MRQDQKNIIEKAIQLHTEFPGEIPFFLEYTKCYAEGILTRSEEYMDKWIRKNQIYDIETWMAFVDTVNTKILFNKEAMEKNAVLFANVLFGDQHRMFTLHCLFSLAQDVPENELFNNRVIQLFS